MSEDSQRPEIDWGYSRSITSDRSSVHRRREIEWVGVRVDNEGFLNYNPPAPSAKSQGRRIVDGFLDVALAFGMLLGLGLVIGLFTGTTAGFVVAIMQLMGFH